MIDLYLYFIHYNQSSIEKYFSNIDLQVHIYKDTRISSKGKVNESIDDNAKSILSHKTHRSRHISISMLCRGTMKSRNMLPRSITSDDKQ